MADIEYGAAIDEGEASGGVGIANAVNLMGALVSAALIVGLAYWGYQLMLRDVSGVPVVRALEGPMRVAPENPGGTDADYQGLAVNNIAAVGEAEAPADRLVLAPQPTALTEEDQPSQELAAVVEHTDPVAVPADTPEAVAASQVPSLPQAEPEPADQAALIQATLMQLEENATAAGTLGTAIPTSVAGVSTSPQPVLRPQMAALTQAEPSAKPDVSDTVRSMDPADIPVGTRLAQLGAFETIEIARSEWLNASAKFEDFMADKTRVIEKAQSGGKVFYRLRAYGFEDLSDAREFCSALLAGKANCIPVVTR